MMASGKPSLVLGNPASEVKTFLENANAGRYFSQPDVSTAIEQLEAWRQDADCRTSMGIEAREYVLKHFSRKEILSNWISELSQLLNN